MSPSSRPAGSCSLVESVRSERASHQRVVEREGEGARVELGDTGEADERDARVLAAGQASCQAQHAVQPR